MTHRSPLRLLVCALLAASAPALADDILVNGDFARGDGGWRLATNDMATATVVNVAGAGEAQRAVRYVVAPAAEAKPWSVRLAQPVGQPIRKGQQVTLAFRARSPEGVEIGAFVEQAADPFRKLAQGRATLRDGWQEFTFAGAAAEDYPEGGWGVVFHLGAAAGTIEITDVRLLAPGMQRVDTAPAAPQPAAPASAPAVPEGGRNVLANASFDAGVQPWVVSLNDRGTSAVVAEGGHQVLRLALTPRDADQPWIAQLRQPVNAALPQGQALRLKVRARSPESLKLDAFVQESAEPYGKSVTGRFTLTPQWQDLVATGAAARTFASGEATVALHLLHGAGTIEIGSVELEVPGLAADAPANKPAEVELVVDPNAPRGVPIDAAKLDGRAAEIHAELAALPAKGEPVLSTPDRFVAMGEAFGSVTVVPAEGQPFAQALRMEAREKPELHYFFQARQPNLAPIRKGDALVATFWARAVEGQAETGEARAELVLEERGGKYEKSVEFPFRVGPKWTPMVISFAATRDFAPGHAQANLRAGYGRQTIEVGGLNLTNYGASVSLADLPNNPLDYAGRELDALWRKAAAERIERIRKADLSIQVLDASGDPVPDAQVRFAMQKHAFGFGTAVAAAQIVRTDADGERYRRTLLENFNKVVFENDLKWINWENLANRDRTMEAIRWVHGHGLPIRGHVLVWPGWASKMNPQWKYLPDDLKRMAETMTGDEREAAMRERINGRIRDAVTTLADYVAEWDVINETYSNHALMDIMGDDVMVEWFKVAHEIDPDAELYYNDYTMLSGGALDERRIDHFYETMTYLTENGAPVHGIGEQGHFGSVVTPPERMLAILDRFSSFGLPIQITEFDVSTTSHELQADYLRDFYTAAFSHPSVNGILMWGFWEGQHWMPDAAMWTRDWTIKPVGERYRDLVFGEWWTDEAVATGADGRAAIRGFHGAYRVTATLPDGTAIEEAVTLPADGAAVTLRSAR